MHACMYAELYRDRPPQLRQHAYPPHSAASVAGVSTTSSELASATGTATGMGTGAVKPVPGVVVVTVVKGTNLTNRDALKVPSSNASAPISHTHTLTHRSKAR
jgi:hypothetical protein